MDIFELSDLLEEEELLTFIVNVVIVYFETIVGLKLSFLFFKEVLEF